MMLNEPFSKESLNNFLRDFLPDYQLDERSVRTPDKSILTEVTQLGTSRKVEVTVLEAECEETDTNRRIAITQAAFKVLREHSIRNAIIAFHDGADQWRLSLLTSKLEIKDGKVVKKDSNPRRYSYLLGVGAKTVTPYKYLVEKGRVEDIKQLQERFSVEVVNKQFYASVADLFTKLVGGERGTTKYPGLLKINSVVSQNVEHQEFAVRLIGRIIFSWFLKEKKSTAGVAIVPNELLSLDAVAINADYYHSILEPLFFELLNKRVENRHESLREAPFSTVPYLNGGLFSPQRGDFYSQNSFNGAGTPGLTHIPNEWFSELFTVLEQYNFTVDENTSYDVDLSIDPEMLGRIFENLLAEINPETGESARKSTGSFYTPREIVDYMVDSSLLEFLKTKTGTDEKKLKALISWGQADDDEHPLSDDERLKIVTALAGLTILDPACGSGAFPIGILQKVVYILQQADPRAEIWLENQLKNIASPELKRDIQEKYESENYDWLRKYGVIRETIFGIDIQTIATEISKLRCFLTLIIEEEVDDSKPNRGVHALPNLDFKFVTANSLVSLPDSNATAKSKGLNLFEDASHIEQLKGIRNQYFGANADERARLQVEFKNLQMDMLRSRIASSNSTSDLYNELSDWDPFSHKATEWFDAEWMFGLEGFDIVIGNPPYIRHRDLPKDFKELLKKTYSSGNTTSDIYCYFYEFAYLLCKDEGVATYITSNKWLRAKYGQKIRNLLRTKTSLLTLIDLGGGQFESATVDTNILIFKKTEPMPDHVIRHGSSIPRSVTELKNLPQSYLNDDGYALLDSAQLEIKSKLTRAGITLERWPDAKINYGILTGRNDIKLANGTREGVFIIDEDKRRELIREHPSSADVLKPILRGRDIYKYGFNWDGKYLVSIHYGMHKLIDDYPAIKNHLTRFKESLESRAQVKRGDHHWIELDQNPSSRYMQELASTKIIYPNISKEFNVAYEDSGYLVNQKCFFITGKSLKYLLAVLNSKLNFYYFKTIGASLGDAGYEMSKIFVNKLPIPRVTDENESAINLIVDEIIELKNRADIVEDSNTKARVDALRHKIDVMLYDACGLTPEEIAIVEGS